MSERPDTGAPASGAAPTGTSEAGGRQPAVEDTVAVASAVAGDTAATGPDAFGAGDDTRGDDEDPATPRFQEPVPPDGT